MRVVAVVDPGSRVYDLATAFEVFEDRTHVGVPPTSIAVAAQEPTVALGRVSVPRDVGLEAALAADLVLVPGRQVPDDAPPPAVIEIVRRTAANGVAVAALCTGAFTLGEAGLLDGVPCTTHWRWCDRLARRYPQAQVRPNVLYAGDGGVWTSAGVSAGADLMLQLVRRALGSAAAATIARSMVTPASRPGSQAQYVPPLRTPRPGDLESLQLAVLGALDRPWPVAEMAAVAGLSERTLLRRFAAELGESPAAWLIGVRLAAAQELLETTTLEIESVAHAVGMGSADLLRKHFRARHGLSPSAHRAAMRQARAGDGQSPDRPWDAARRSAPQAV